MSGWRKYAPVVAVIAIGGIAMIGLGFSGADRSVLGWVGGIAGLAVGVALAAGSGEHRK